LAGALVDRGQKRALVAIAVSQLFVLALWFSTAAIVAPLEEAWGLSSSETTYLALAVQLGFVVGALGFAVGGVVDAVPARRLFTISAVAGALANATLLVLGSGDLFWAVALRFTTGVTLAGVYPSGLKAMSGWFQAGRGMALGALVGALTVGSASPHLISGLGLDWQGVLLAASGLALVGAAIMALGVGDGPYETKRSGFEWRQVGNVLRNRGFRLATYGYLGHMWELYAMWTWAAAWLLASAEHRGGATEWVPIATFATIGIGGAGAWLAGRYADRRGRTRAAGLSLAVSGSCALITPLLFGAAPIVVVPVFLIWGFAVVADSAQFSAMVTEVADDTYRGTALTLQTAIGFLLTLVTIRGVPLLADAWGWQWAFPVLGVGPVLGIAAMVSLKRSPFVAALAGGRG
jgi:MFS family permease